MFYHICWHCGRICWCLCMKTFQTNLSAFKAGLWVFEILLCFSLPADNILRGNTTCLKEKYAFKYTVWVKKNPPYGFLTFFPKRLGIFNHFLHTYYTFLSMLDFKFLVNYLLLWWSYAILSATTQRIFTFH